MFACFLLVLATITVFHAAFSTFEYFSHLKALGRPEEPLPPIIVLETLAALLLGVLGASFTAPPLKEITWASEMRKRKIDEMDSRLGFADYLTRGRNIFSGPSRTMRR